MEGQKTERQSNGPRAVWGLIRPGERTPEREAALTAAAKARGWAYQGTLERQGIGLDSLQGLVEGTGVRSLLVEDVAALAQDPEEAAVRLLLLEARGVQVLLAKGPGADLLQKALAGVGRPSQQPEVRAKLQARALRGLTLGRLPYGYGRNEKGQPQIDDAEAATVRLIFDLCLQGTGIRAIVAELNRRGLITRRGGAWSMITARDMLRNRFYTGTYSRLGVRVAGNHPAIVSRHVFQQAQDRLDRGAERAGYARGEPFLLSGLLACGACGQRMIGVTRQQSWRRKDGTRMLRRYRYYQCGSRTNRGLCTYHTRPAETLEKEVLARLEGPGRSAPSQEPQRHKREPESLAALRHLVRQAAKERMPTPEVRRLAQVALEEGGSGTPKGQQAALRRQVEQIVVHDGRLEVRFRR